MRTLARGDNGECRMSNVQHKASVLPGHLRCYSGRVTPKKRRPPRTRTQATAQSTGYLGPRSLTFSLPLPLPLPLPFPFPSRRSVRVGKMEASFTLNTRREAVVLTGLPLLALSFQTLGTSSIIPTSPDLVISPPFRDYLFRYWHCQHISLFTKVPPLISCFSLPSTCSMVSGHRPHPLKTLSVV